MKHANHCLIGKTPEQVDAFIKQQLSEGWVLVYVRWTNTGACQISMDKPYAQANTSH